MAPELNTHRRHRPNPDDDVWFEATIWPDDDIPNEVQVSVCTTWSGAFSSHMTMEQFVQFLDFLHQTGLEAWPAQWR